MHGITRRGAGTLRPMVAPLRDLAEGITSGVVGHRHSLWPYDPSMRRFSGKESERLRELDGVELASFWRRGLAFLIDWITFCVVLMALLAFLLRMREWLGHVGDVHGHIDLRPGRIVFSTTDKDLAFFGQEWFEVLTNIALPILFFGLITWAGRGRSLGKFITRIRIVSTVHRHLGMWHAIERSLGYAAAALEGGFGFFQFFIDPNRRCVQDRIAETIVITERAYKAL